MPQPIPGRLTLNPRTWRSKSPSTDFDGLFYSKSTVSRARGNAIPFLPPPSMASALDGGRTRHFYNFSMPQNTRRKPRSRYTPAAGISAGRPSRSAGVAKESRLRFLAGWHTWTSGGPRSSAPDGHWPPGSATNMTASGRPPPWSIPPHNASTWPLQPTQLGEIFLYSAARSIS